MGIEPIDILGPAFDGFDYKITEIKANDDKATVTYDIYCKDLSEFTENAKELGEEFGEALLADSAALQKMTQSEQLEYLQDKTKEFFSDYFAGLDTNESGPYELEVELKDGKWEITTSEKQMGKDFKEAMGM